MGCSEGCTPAPLGERGLEGEVEVVELAANPTMESVFLYADLEAVGVVLVNRAERGREGNREATEGDVADEGASGLVLHKAILLGFHRK